MVALIHALQAITTDVNLSSSLGEYDIHRPIPLLSTYSQIVSTPS
jgi:hypothetical protein